MECEETEKARNLGELLAWSHDHEMDTGTLGSSDFWIRENYKKILDSISLRIGKEAAEEAFSEGYDEIIDFSLNTGWRGDPDFLEKLQ
jgi:hypothetical protein